MNGRNFKVNNVGRDLCDREIKLHDCSVKSRGSVHEMCGVVVPARAFIYFLFQLTKKADSYGIVL